MTTLDGNFESQLEEALLDSVEEQADDIGNWMLEVANRKWRRYASANDYDIDHIWRDSSGPDVSRDGRGVHVRVEWPFSALFEFGVDPHVIEATDADMLAFEWPEMEGKEFGNTGRNFEEVFSETWPTVFFPSVNWGSETGGIPESRAVRDMMRELRGEWRS